MLATTAPAATYVVTNTADSGPGSLRQAIIDANATVGFDAIQFQIGGAGVQLSQPLSALPNITDPVGIDGTTQPGFAGTPLIELSGVNTDVNVNGLTLLSGGCTVRGLAINRFTRDGIRIEDGGTNIIVGNHLGLAPNGTTARGNGQAGISVVRSARNRIGGSNAAERNVISGGNLSGVIIDEPAAVENRVEGNFIGTTAAGTASLGNLNYGVILLNVSNNIVGGTAAGAGNVISGNHLSGVVIQESVANSVMGNFIGTDHTGTVAISNTLNGVTVVAASNNFIGGTEPGAGNLISGNGSRGVSVVTAGADRNVLAGNLIGTTANGRAALPNQLAGVVIWAGTANVIGGPLPGARNVIAGNKQSGILLFSNTTTANVIEGNYIGVDITGGAALGNQFSGVTLDAAPGNFIGSPGAGNIISGNLQNGIEIKNAGAISNVVQGNLIGTDATGALALANIWSGVRIESAANLIGGPLSGGGNLISGNLSNGIYAAGASCRSNRVEGNLIGTDRTGSTAIANGNYGIVLSQAGANFIGSAVPAAANVISGNALAGLNLTGTSTRDNRIQGNRIGTDAAGQVALPNGYGGVFFESGVSNLLGGPLSGAGNLVSGNLRNAILLNTNAVGNVIQGNLVGVRADGVSPLPNQWHGIDVSGAPNLRIGGMTAGEGNILANALSGGYDGVRVRPGATNVWIQGNSFFGNGGSSANGLAIDLEPDGLNTNDNCDGDGGANLGQNFPILTNTIADLTRARIQGTLNSTASRDFTLQFYASPACDASTRGEGQVFLGAQTVRTGAGCVTNFIVTVSNAAPAGWVVTATATDSSGNTSEFSPCVAASQTPSLAVVSGDNQTITLAWPAGQGGAAYMLTQATNLNAPILWQPVPPPAPVLGSGFYTWSSTATNATRFYRLMLE